MYTQHMLRLLWKMIENMFFRNSEYIGIGGRLPPKFIISIDRGKEVQVGAIPPNPPKKITALVIRTK